MAEIFGIVPEGGLNLRGLVETHLDILTHGFMNTTETEK